MVQPKHLSFFSTKKNHAGFMLLAPIQHDGSGHCVFMLTPISKDGLESKLGIVVSELKDMGEHKYSFRITDTGCHIAIHPENMPRIDILLNREYIGTVKTDYDVKDEIIGIAEAMRNHDK